MDTVILKYCKGIVVKTTNFFTTLSTASILLSRHVYTRTKTTQRFLYRYMGYSTLFTQTQGLLSTCNINTQYSMLLT